MSREITLDNIRQYIEGNKNKLLAEAGLKEDWYLEQIAYRQLKCQDCWIEGHPAYGPRTCKVCTCRLPGKWYVTQSCNYGARFPDLMNEQDWIKFKEENAIH